MMCDYYNIFNDVKIIGPKNLTLEALFWTYKSIGPMFYEKL